ncbi:hypothetical protein [Microbacterium karelineae]|uniref:hypothetical protein n=1 Tax=Microbacterium karelineae TaxID=2654283 RepID=UPI0012EA8082|nr:hypothetical protein [Microbacterium karelineae]
MDAGETRSFPPRAFVDESSAARPGGKQVYLVCAAILETSRLSAEREALMPLLRPGQRKLHWRDESAVGRRRVADLLAERQLMSAVVTHVALEARSAAQNARDLAHIIGLQNQGLDRRLRIEHVRGADEPLLWIPDAVLGAVNASALGEPAYLEALRDTIVLDVRTPDSDLP